MRSGSGRLSLALEEPRQLRGELLRNGERGHVPGPGDLNHPAIGKPLGEVVPNS